MRYIEYDRNIQTPAPMFGSEKQNRLDDSALQISPSANLPFDTHMMVAPQAKANVGRCFDTYNHLRSQINSINLIRDSNTEIGITNSLTDMDFELFLRLFAENIATLYSDTTIKTAESIIEKHKRGFDFDGYFTKKKTIWKATGIDDETHAFTVVTEKRGGSIKFGPTIVVADMRNRGVGSSFRLKVEKEYEKLGFRKAYSTTHMNNHPAIQYLLKIGYDVELHLKKQYCSVTDELVLSKMLDKYRLDSPEISKQTTSNHVPKFVVEYMHNYYDEIDEIFFKSIGNKKVKTQKTGICEDFFINKNKLVHINTFQNQFAVIAPKRGRAAQISPLILSDDKKNNGDFIESLIQTVSGLQLRKAYTFIPLDRIDYIDQLKDKAFQIEGLITEPYKPNVDFLILSRFIERTEM